MVLCIFLCIIGFAQCLGKLITAGGVFHAAVNTGDTAFHFFRVSTDIPSKLVKEGYVTISDVTIKIGEGKTQSGVVVDTSGDWVKLIVEDNYNNIKADGVVLTAPAPNTTTVFTFTVSGLAE